MKKLQENIPDIIPIDGEQAHYTGLRECHFCEEINLITQQSRQYEASVWDGMKCRQILHADGRCHQCKAYYKLNYLSHHGENLNMLKRPTDETIVLSNVDLKFTYAYPKQLWIHLCRAMFHSMPRQASSC